ncbi:histidine phosphatase family protein [Aestuariimicrobium kwangyangense]|uniref:histidine phosphatase family protein n=1 Tax=Aestuariimicrobium kwangyangense TaxID=396389 RepID=UPI0003B46380
MKVAPPTDTLVHLVRHGEVFNPTGVLYGRLPDFHLSDNGRAMADRLGEWFADVPLTALRCSPLERARETIAPIAAAHPELEVVAEPGVIEAVNDFEGQVFGAGNQALRKPANWWKLRNPLRPSWGEPFTHVRDRMVEAVAEAAVAAGEAGQAVVVSHQLPIWIARLDAEGRRLVHDPRKRQCNVASVTTLHLREGRVVRVSYTEPAGDLVKAKDRGKSFSSGS